MYTVHILDNNTPVCCFTSLTWKQALKLHDNWMQVHASAGLYISDQDGNAIQCFTRGKVDFI